MSDTENRKRCPTEQPQPICINRRSQPSFPKATARSSFRRDAIAALTVAIVALPLSMAIAVARASHRTAGCTRQLSADFWSQPRRQSFPDRRSRRGLHRVGRSYRRPVWCGRSTPHCSDIRRDADDRGVVAAGRAYPIHPPCRHRGLHLRHRRHDHGQPAQGFRRAHAVASGTGPTAPGNWRRLAPRFRRSALRPWRSASVPPLSFLSCRNGARCGQPC